MKQAVCALIRNPDGLILGVSRRNKPHDMNLPGGKVDHVERLEEACKREVLEETGVLILNLRQVFHRPCDGETTYEAFTFAADYEGEPRTVEDGVHVRWITWAELLHPDNTFSVYNNRLLNKLLENV